MQDTSVLEVLDLRVGIESNVDSESFAGVSSDFEGLTYGQLSSVELDGELLEAGEAEGVGILASLELEGEDSHTNQVASVDTLVGHSYHSLDALEVGTLGGPIS